MRFCLLILFVLVSAAGSAPPAEGDVPDGFFDQNVATLSGSGPVDFEFLPDGRVLMAVQLSGQLRLWRPGFGGTALVDSIPGVSHGGPEAGLVGLAVDPEFPDIPYVYVHYTAVDSTIKIRRYRAGGSLVDPAGLLSISEPYDILVVPDLDPDHNGGTLEFGLDDMLYVSLGDDQDNCAAQDSASLKGVICRLDVLGLPPGPGGPPNRADITPSDNPFLGGGGDEELVFCYGLRNPFRFAVHPVTGELLIGDVGQVGYEEINRALGGENFGWPFREGPAVHLVPGCTEPGGAGASTYDPPDYYYPWGGSAVIGGVVYKPQGGEWDFPAEYDGVFFFSDYIQSFVRALEFDAGAWALRDSVPGQPTAEDWATIPFFVNDWEMGPDGALYYLRQYNGGYIASAGELHRIVFTSGPIAVRDDLPPPRLQMTPNPVYAGGMVRGRLLEPASTVDVFNVRGALVRTLPTLERGTRFRWDGRDGGGNRVAPGLYWARARGSSEAAGKIVVLP